jgi:Transposase IS116/IS110/IS902 family
MALVDGGQVLGIGIDWAEEFHDVALGTQEKGVIEQFRIEHGPAGVAALVTRVLRLEPDPAEVRVVLETRHGLLVEALLDAGSPWSRSTPTWSPAGAARRGRRTTPRTPGSAVCWPWTGMPRSRAWSRTASSAGNCAIGRDDERAARDQRRLLNRLRADLQTTYPAALALAGKDLGAPTVLRLLERWPTQPELAQASREELVEFARTGRHGWPDRFADRVQSALAAPSLPTRDYLVRAKAAGIRLAAVQLLALHEARRGCRPGWPSCCWAVPAPAETTPGKTPTRGRPSRAARYLSMPGLGDLLAARVAGEIGEHITQFDSPAGLQCYAGTAPVTRRSGKSDFVVARRLAHNHYLAAAVHQWAFCSLLRSNWARELDKRTMRVSGWTARCCPTAPARCRTRVPEHHRQNRAVIDAHARPLTPTHPL